MAEIKTDAPRRAASTRRTPARGGVIVEEDSAPADSAEERAPRPTCPFVLCPICMALSAVGEAKPELVEHLLAASREALLALRALIDARLENAVQPPPAKLERLTIE
jgi:hypothetical protein